MLFTASSGPGEAGATAVTTLGAFLGAVSLGDVVLLGVLRRALLDQRPNQLLVRLDPVTDDLPLRPVPLLELHRATALVIGAGDLQRLDEVGRPDGRDPRRVEIQILQPPADLLTGERLLPELALRHPDRLHRHDPGEDPAIVIDAPHPLLVDHVALAGAVHHPLDLLDDLELLPRGVDRRADVALRRRAHRLHVFLRAGPEVPDDVVHREAHPRGVLQHRRVHHPPAGDDHPVRLELADLQPLRLLLTARGGNLDDLRLVPVLLGLLLEDDVRLLAVGTPVMEVDDLLPLQLRHPTLALADVPDDVGVLAPVMGDQREDVGEVPAVGRVGPAVGDGDQGNLVLAHLGDERVGDAGAVGVEHRRPRGALAFEPLVALDATVGLVLGLALLPGQLDAVDSPVAQVDQVHVCLLYTSDAAD